MVTSLMTIVLSYEEKHSYPLISGRYDIHCYLVYLHLKVKAYQIRVKNQQRLGNEKKKSSESYIRQKISLTTTKHLMHSLKEEACPW